MSRTINAAGAILGLGLLVAGAWQTFGGGPAMMALGAALFGLGVAGLR